MDNLLLLDIARLANEGLHPMDVMGDLQGRCLTASVRLAVAIRVTDWVAGPEGGDELPRHTVSVDTTDLPAGVSVSTHSRYPDWTAVYEVPDVSTVWAWFREIACVGGAARDGLYCFGGCSWLCKTVTWLPADHIRRRTSRDPRRRVGYKIRSWR